MAQKKESRPRADVEAETLKKEQKESGQPMTPPACEAIRNAEYQEAKRRSADLEGGGEEKEPELNGKREGLARRT